MHHTHKTLAKEIFIFCFITLALTIFIQAVHELNMLFVEMYPRVSIWVIPFVVALVVVSICAFYWRRLKEADTLKYEFIAILTHKFRTPLTYIKWSIESLAENSTVAERQHAVETLRSVNNELVELTDILINMARQDECEYQYCFASTNIATITQNTVLAIDRRIKDKKIAISFDIDRDLPQVNIDEKRIVLAIQIFLENAINYTPENGHITISLKKGKDRVLFSIQDSGIGIPKEELPHVFSKFFRGRNAKLKDSGGVGIGLYMARDIVRRNKGELGVDSPGEGLGTTFWFTLPLA